ncbi:hypothetical protein RRG08_037739 [Elysia crispata]|uniref:Uncharacterized protein n=1 Tax=Elysia crispata TaxID=231223 RepID=A0AAE1A844_9GAST|nr:hypothetical protein RRG08_037739 [Elysia crispata]
MMRKTGCVTGTVAADLRAELSQEHEILTSEKFDSQQSQIYLRDLSAVINIVQLSQLSHWVDKIYDEFLYSFGWIHKPVQSNVIPSHAKVKPATKPSYESSQQTP